MLQYPLRPHYRQYGDQGELESVEMGIQSTPIAGGKLQKEVSNLKLHYKLATAHNYDKNALEHRITHQTLESSIVDTCGTEVDSTFASHELNIQANYAIGVFKDNKFILTPLHKF